MKFVLWHESAVDLGRTESFWSCNCRISCLAPHCCDVVFRVIFDEEIIYGLDTMYHQKEPRPPCCWIIRVCPTYIFNMLDRVGTVSMKRASIWDSAPDRSFFLTPKLHYCSLFLRGSSHAGSREPDLIARLQSLQFLWWDFVSSEVDASASPTQSRWRRIRKLTSNCSCVSLIEDKPTGFQSTAPEYK